MGPQIKTKKIYSNSLGIYLIRLKQLNKPLAKPIKLSDVKSKEWMSLLISRAKIIGALGEVPISAVVLDNIGRCIGHGSNNRARNGDPLGHAEILSLIHI